MRLSHIFITLPLFLLAACSTTPPPEVKEIIATPTITTDFSNILGSNYRGLLFIKDKQTYFEECASERVLIVHADEALDNIYKKTTSEVPEPVYIEFSGEIMFPINPHDRADAEMRIDRVRHMALAKKSLQCARPINTSWLKAKGEAPYWRLSIDGQNLSFATKAQNQIYQIENNKFQTTKVDTIKSTNALNQRLDLAIEPNDCYNKNNEYWGYTAKITSAFGDLKGCAEPSWPTLENNFTGYYLSQSPTTIINLTLNTDHTVEYNEKSGQQTILKSGFWKNNTPDSVVVMLTHAPLKNIREEFIFKRDGLTLSTQEINIDNIIRPLSTSLLFNKMNAKEGISQAVVKHIDRSFTAERIAPIANVDVDIQAAVNRYFKIHRTDPQKSKFNAVKYDLNGDGIKEAIVLLDWCTQTGCELLIFEGNKEGYRFSSRISQVSTPIIVAKSQHFFWQSLLINKNQQRLLLDYDGLSYPIHTSNIKNAASEGEATGVVLFSQGTPKNWFSIVPQ